MRTAAPPLASLLAASILGCLALAWNQAPARASSVEATWWAVNTEHFEVFANTSPRRAIEVARRLELFRSVFAGLSPGLELDSPAPIRIFAFQDQRSFAPFRSGPAPEEGVILGQFSSRPAGNYMTLDAGTRGNGAFAVVFHELVHYFNKCNFPAMPLWLNEGLAEYYSSLRFEDQSVFLGTPIPRHMRWLRAGGTVDVAQLVEVEAQRSGGHRNTQQFYAGSWALVHYLLSSGEDRSGELADLLIGQRRGVDPVDLFESAFRMSTEQMATEVHRFIELGLFDGNELRVPGLQVGQPRLSELHSVDVDIELGHLALHLRRETLASQLFSSALAQDPFAAEALAGLGYLRTLEGRSDEAQVLFDQAQESGLDSARAHLQLGRFLIDRAGRQENHERRRDILLAARLAIDRMMALDPSFAEAEVVAAQIELMLGERFERAATLLKSAAARLPWRADIIAQLIRAELAVGRELAARKIVESESFAIVATEEMIESAGREVDRAMLIRDARDAVEGADFELAVELFDQAIELTSDRETSLRMEEHLERLIKARDGLD